MADLLIFILFPVIPILDFLLPNQNGNNYLGLTAFLLDIFLYTVIFKIFYKKIPKDFSKNILTKEELIADRNISSREKLKIWC